jgi:D-alanyl-D-alanine dipeptidase
MTNLVEITPQDFDVYIDLRYATKNNVCNVEMYSSGAACYLAVEAGEMLKKAVKLAKNLGYKIKIWDAYRPIEVQQFMYDKFPSSDLEGGFVSNPLTGSTPHCRGVAIDLTLCDLAGNEIEMGTDFDDFSALAAHRCSEVSLEAQKNRLILLGIMTLAGFDFYSQEWWHYQAFEARKYPIIEAPAGFSMIK